MMLLLVIFMITAPMMQGGVDVQLPKGEAKALEPKSGLVVTIDRKGAVFVDETQMSFEEFRAAYKALSEQRAKRGVYLRADASVPYGSVVRVLGVMVQAGTSGVGMIVEPERP
jgi:biopolymer transport protein ExbD/biopolymer transport protein TolR